MKRKKANFEDISTLLTALIPRMDDATKRQMLSLISLVMSTMFMITPIASAGATQGSSYTIVKNVTDVAGHGPGGNVTAAGDVIRYQVNVTNNGNVTLENVTVTDPLINLTNNVTVLGAGESLNYTGNYTVTQADMNSNGNGTGFINNNATVDCDQLDPQNDSVQVPIANCTIDKTVTTVVDVSGNAKGNVTAAGDIISYKVNVTNNGKVELTNVTVTDPLINNLTVVKSIDNDTVLDVGENWNYTGNYTVTRADITNDGTLGDGFITNNATVDCDQLAPQNDSVRVPIDTSCSIEKTVMGVNGNAEGNVTAAGDIITYQVKVTNDGITNLTNVTVIDSLINNLTVVKSIDNDTVLDVGENWNYTGNYTVTQEDLNSNGNGTGFINNNATVNCDQLGPKSDRAQVQIEWNPACTIDKIVTDVDGKGSNGNVTKEGDVVSYQIIVTNDGNVDLSNVTVDDPLINDPLINNTLIGPIESNSNDTVLNVGETWNYTGNYTVTRADVTNNNGNGLVNNATVDCDQLGPQNDSVQVPIDLWCSIDKTVTTVTDANGQPKENITAAGDIIGYQVDVTNNGIIDLTNVTVTDSLIDLVGPTPSINNDTVLTVGETQTYTGNYTVTQADINNDGTVGDGFIKNTASIDCDQLGPKSDSAEVPIGRVADYSIFKSSIGADENGDCIINAPRDIIQYRIVVKNEGNVDLTGISVNDPMITLTGPTGDDFDPEVLNPGETWVYTGDYSLTRDDIYNGNGSINNIATVSSNELPEKSSSVDMPIAQNADLSIYKSIVGIDETGDYLINNPGDIIKYQVAVKNNGNIDLTGVSVDDPMITLTGPTGDSVDHGVLNPGETWVYTGEYTVTQEDIDNNGDGKGFIVNTATASCNELSSESSNQAMLPIIHSIITVTPEPDNSKVTPVANFNTNITSGYAPLSVQFTDLSQNAAGWNWNFGDGATSTEKSPAHTYSAAGTYTANLTVSNGSLTASKTAPITVLQVSGGSSSGGSGGSSGGSIGYKPRVISDSGTNNASNGSTGDATTKAAVTETQPEPKTVTTEANVEPTPVQTESKDTSKKGKTGMPGFEMVYAITGLLAVFLCRRR